MSLKHLNNRQSLLFSKLAILMMLWHGWLIIIGKLLEEEKIKLEMKTRIIQNKLRRAALLSSFPPNIQLPKFYCNYLIVSTLLDLTQGHSLASMLRKLTKDF
jgi:hypothetical protein